MQNVAHRRTRHAKHPHRRGRARGTKSRPSGDRGSLSGNQACSAARSWSRSAPRRSAGYAADLAKGHPLARVSFTTRPARHRRGDRGARAGAQGAGRRVHRDFPIDGLDPQARNAAEPARCAHDQGKFSEYHDALFANAPRPAPSSSRRMPSRRGWTSRASSAASRAGPMRPRCKRAWTRPFVSA